MSYPFIPFPPDDAVGGPATFMWNLRRYLDSAGLCYDTAPNDCGIFFPVAYDLSVLREIRRRGGRVVQRLDGIYYPSKHGAPYAGLNRDIREIYSGLADHVVFQSEYSRRQCLSMFGGPPRGTWSIIANGADRSLFYPSERRGPSRPLRFVTTGNFRGRDMAEPIVSALDLLAGELRFELHVVGPVADDGSARFFDRPYVVMHGKRNMAETAEALRECDVFLYSQLNPPCPNSVIEAVSCALPVVSFDGGAMGELCFFSRDLLAPVSGDVFQRYEDFRPELLAQKIRLCVRNYGHYRALALEHADLYPFEECGRRYAEVFDAVFPERSRIRHVAPRKGGRRFHFMKRLKRKVKGVAARGLRFVLRRAGDGFVADLLIDEARRRSESLPPAEALRLLFSLDSRLYVMEGQAAIRYDGGVHAKHRLTDYHRFFVSNIGAGESVLDVGCGIGALAADMARQVPGCTVYGMDMSRRNIDAAVERYGDVGNCTFVCGEAPGDLPDRHFDVVVLSNVLEHVERRRELLGELSARCSPGTFLIRVPCFDRDWRVPLRRELGVDWRLDATHCTEYLHPEFRAEVEAAGLFVESETTQWGEIWAVVRPCVAAGDGHGK